VKRWLVVALVVVVLGGVAAVVWSRATRCSDVNVTVFLEPDVSEAQRLKVRAELDKIEPDIDYVDQEAAYEEFSEMFRSSPEMVNDVSPQDLPPSFRFVVEDDLSPAEYRRLEGLSGVRSIARADCDNPLGRRPIPMSGD
jgi:cell division protein FtsX